MFKKILIACFAVVFGIVVGNTALACNSGNCGETPSATASSGASSSATVHITPVTNNTSGSSASSVVGIENNPNNLNLAGGGTAMAGGGTGIGIGGSSTALAANGDQTMILDMSNHSKNYTRQFAPAYGVSPGPGAQQFDSWGPAWNVTPIGPETMETGAVDAQVEVVRERVRIYRQLPESSMVALRGNLFDSLSRRTIYMPPSGKKVGDMSVVLTEEYDLRDALNYAAATAMKNGADQVEVIAYNARKKPTLDDWSVGFGGSGSGIIGDAEKAAVSGGGGTHISRSSIVNDSQPWLSVVFWKNGSKKKKAVVTGYSINSAGANITPTAVKAVAGEGD